MPGLLNLTGEKSYRTVSMYERVLRVGGGESNRKVSMYERVLRVGGVGDLSVRVEGGKIESCVDETAGPGG